MKTCVLPVRSRSQSGPSTAEYATSTPQCAHTYTYTIANQHAACCTTDACSDSITTVHGELLVALILPMPTACTHYCRVCIPPSRVGNCVGRETYFAYVCFIACAVTTVLLWLPMVPLYVVMATPGDTSVLYFAAGKGESECVAFTLL